MDYRKSKSGPGSLLLIIMLPLFVLSMALLVAEQIFNVFAGRLYYIVLGWLNKHYYYREWLRFDLIDCESILELGCGAKSPLLHIGYGGKTDAIDIWQPYIERHNMAGDYRRCWQSDILDFEFPQKAYDAVVICDVMEHLQQERVSQVDLFGLMEKCARKKVIIFAPNGFIENDLVDEDPYQEHLSAWEPRDYKTRGYKVLGATGLRFLFGKASLPKRPQFMFYILGMLSQPLVYHFPKLAWHSYAVKELN